MALVKEQVAQVQKSLSHLEKIQYDDKKNRVKPDQQGSFDQKTHLKKRGIFFEKEEAKIKESTQH
ncbi:hypothetical protein [Candidatus Rhabdochlamydia oedothoracis]|uniref:hypothetical protein n=1 Tax=Candidatus Rhabdochlamydia oedothoracis TaxID=2720720 RepID=UPI001C652D07|nr:hypothetical protein [Candidatus Rhabdochlamydia oedothoracis]